MNHQMRISRRSRALFRALSNDFLLREQFVTDPATILSEYIEGKAMPTEVAAGANQLLYAVLANRPMLNWLREYAREPDMVLTNSRFADGLAKAIGRHGDATVAAALIRLGSIEGAPVGQALDLVRLIGAALGGPGRGASGTEFTPGTGTQVSPGTGTQVTPGGGTQVSPGTGTQVSPGTGTQVTPGGGTQVSPGTGTQITPGGVLVPNWWVEFEITLRALIEYATELSEAGALAATGLEER
ncbi:hypothetical protein [Paraburkholderia sp. MM5477-R1]|uniref:hypothetical protein n=1 Tax=Paraburkholderia sp. MM5477-R1 TaxID=2991062 RepID=UPI003D21F511